MYSSYIRTVTAVDKKTMISAASRLQNPSFANFMSPWHQLGVFNK